MIQTVKGTVRLTKFKMNCLFTWTLHYRHYITFLHILQYMHVFVYTYYTFFRNNKSLQFVKMFIGCLCHITNYEKNGIGHCAAMSSYMRIITDSFILLREVYNMWQVISQFEVLAKRSPHV